MKKIRYAAAGLVVLAGASGLWMYQRAEATEGPAFRTAAVERGTLHATVSATGKLGALRAVQVGTQVSGQVAEILVDFNDRVTQGQLIARIDPTLARQSVADAQAQLERTQAQLLQAQREHARQQQLFDAKMVTESEFGNAQSALAVARANVKSSQVTLDRARQNLAYTNIYAPISGIVVERNVDVGQTVAASLSAPQLFLIANDLSRMQILASVDESDIGMIREGQEARFTVQSYPNDNFTGRVRQVRLQSTTTDNVVNYTAVVEVENPERKLLPGMTATVEFVTGAAENALLVPNAALRFRPTTEQIVAAGLDTLALRGGRRGAGASAAARPSEGGATGGPRARGPQAGADGGQAQRGQRGNGGQAGQAGQGGGQRRSFGTVWYLDKAGKLAFARVRPGLSDGTRTAVQSTQLPEGAQVIVGAAPTEAAPASNNPFQQQRQGGGPRF